MQVSEDAVLSARLNVAVNCGKVGVGLNLAVFRLPASDTDTVSTSLPANDEDKETSAAAHHTTSTPPATVAQVQGHAVYSSTLQTLSASPRSAVLTSNDGVYVVRPTGAFIAPTGLRAGTYLIVPSTFKQLTCKYTLEVYVTPAVASSKEFQLVKTS